MTSVLPEDERSTAARMKPKSTNQKIPIDGANANTRDENRSFLHFSRENLSISDSELEQGFNKPWRYLRVSRPTLLSVIAIAVALVCAGIQIWKLHRVVTNAREIEILKRDVETLRHRMFGKDFIDELKDFEEQKIISILEQLYADESEDPDDDSGEEDIENADYDNNYYEDYGWTVPSWTDDQDDTHEPSTTRSSEVSQAELKSSTSSSANHDRKLVEMLAVHHKVEAKRGQESEKGSHESHKSIARERLLDGSRDHGLSKRRGDSHEKIVKDNHGKQRRAIIDDLSMRNSARDRSSDQLDLPHSLGEVDKDRRKRDVEAEPTVEKSSRSRNRTTETSWDRHPPKKYVALGRSDNSRTFLTTRQSSRRRLTPLVQRKELRRFPQSSKLARKPVQTRGITRRHLRAPRQVYAAHFGADSTLFGMYDDHTGNGRAKHNEGIFRAWRPSDWVTDLGMARHFTLARDGKLTVHEPGLYLVYGQIHYLDEHDENGFHIVVNGYPILQCMDYSPGTGHKSRSCFSAQITVLQAGDHLVLKEVGPARYTLFQHDKSFFGLVKLGDSRQPQQQQRQQQHSTQPPEPL